MDEESRNIANLAKQPIGCIKCYGLGCEICFFEGTISRAVALASERIQDFKPKKIISTSIVNSKWIFDIQ